VSALESLPLLAALKRAGTEHVYADTADVDELAPLAIRAGRAAAEIDGNTVNQPLARKVTARYLADDRFRACRKRFLVGGIPLDADVLPWVYAGMCGWIGADMTARFGGGRDWEVSLQIHMGLSQDAAAAQSAGQLLRVMAPTCLVKVPFAPHAPQCLLVARDLEREGIPVNFTSTFSARQAVMAALLADVTRTNIFMGRLNQGLRAERVGEHVDLEAQRALRELRNQGRVKTRLIVASVHDAGTLEHVAGTDSRAPPAPWPRDGARGRLPGAPGRTPGRARPPMPAGLPRRGRARRPGHRAVQARAGSAWRNLRAAPCGWRPPAYLISPRISPALCSAVCTLT
jgi:transaldolase